MAFGLRFLEIGLNKPVPSSVSTEPIDREKSNLALAERVGYLKGVKACIDLHKRAAAMLYGSSIKEDQREEVWHMQAAVELAKLGAPQSEPVAPGKKSP